MVLLIGELVEEWRCLDDRIDRLTKELETLAKTDPAAARICEIPGVGPKYYLANVAEKTDLCTLAATVKAH